MEKTFAVVTLICVLLQLYQYLLYPVAVIGLAKLIGRRRHVSSTPRLSTSLIICAHNEAGVIGRKIDNSLALDPLPDEIIVVDDGSDDATAAIAEEYKTSRIPVTVLTGQTRGGKSAAMNRGAEVARHDVFVFSDATEIYDTRVLKFLLDEFDDHSVAVVSGMHRIRPLDTDVGASLTGHSEGAYWRYERAIRQAESDLGATVATVGAILAIRAEDWRPLPAGTINDDAWITMTSLVRGRNTRFASKAVSWEDANTTVVQEAIRRRRISAGRMLLLTQKGVWPWRRPWVLIAFLSHKVLRLALPLLMGVGVLCNGIVVLMTPHWPIFSVLLAAHGVVFALAFAGYVAERQDRKWRLAHLAYHVMYANIAGLKAYMDLLHNRSFLMWDKPTR